MARKSEAVYHKSNGKSSSNDQQIYPDPSAGYMDLGAAEAALAPPSMAVMKNSQMAPTPTARRSKKKAARLAQNRALKTNQQQVRDKSLPQENFKKSTVNKKRMVHYTGDLFQRSKTPMQSLDTAEMVIKHFGGYVESRRNFRSVFRVPISKFHIAYDSLYKIAEVINHSVSANDITNQYEDVELRLKIAKKTLKRLQELLAKTEKPEEKISLLQQIERVNQRVESMERQRKILEKKASYSTITVRFKKYHPHLSGSNIPDIYGFEWIKKLGPFNMRAIAEAEFLEFSVPKEMIAMETGKWLSKRWKSVSADGTKFWTDVIDNEPQGSTTFWKDAITKRIKPQYAKIESVKSGNFEIIRAISHSKKPYIYMVGIKAQEEKIVVVQIYFPSESQETRYKTSILASLKKGAL